MGKGYAIFWYYLLIVLFALTPFVLQQYFPFAPFDQPFLLAALLFALILSFNPFMFLWYRERRPTFFSNANQNQVTGTAALITNRNQQLEEAKKKNQELEAKTRELQAKDLELTMANQRLQELERAKSEFVAVTTHQLRTPLSAVKWTLHMLVNDEAGAVSPDQKHFLQVSYESVERVIAIVNELLNIEHVGENQADDYHLVPADLAKLVNGVVSEFTVQAKEKSVNLEIKLPTNPLPSVSLDPVKISMVVESLVDNAIKYTAPGGQVTVSLNDEKLNSARRIVEVVVADTGIGIPEAEQSKIFQRFYRAANAVRMSPNGLGLGLFATKDIVAHHGGEIWFTSNEGKGTEFHFTIPLAPAKL